MNEKTRETIERAIHDIWSISSNRTVFHVTDGNGFEREMVETARFDNEVRKITR